MCPFKTFAFQPSTLPGLSRKLREGLGGTCCCSLHFQTSIWLSASSPAMKLTAVAGPMGAEGADDQRWPRGSGTCLWAWSQTGRPHLSLQNCPATNFSCAVLQRDPRVPHNSAERVDEPVQFGSLLTNKNNILFDWISFSSQRVSQWNYFQHYPW